MKLNMVFVSILIFSMVATALYLIPSQTGGLWEAYGYSPTSENITEFDRTSATYDTIKDIKCDLNPDDEDCVDVKRQSLIDIGIHFIDGMVKGAYGVLITFTKGITLVKSILYDLAGILKVPRLIVDGLVLALEVTLLYTVTLIIFNRSDSG